MIEREKVEGLVGHEPGGVCPFGINDNIPVYLDTSLKKHEFIYPACGESNNAIKISPNKLYEITNSIKWVSVCK